MSTERYHVRYRGGPLDGATTILAWEEFPATLPLEFVPVLPVTIQTHGGLLADADPLEECQSIAVYRTSGPTAGIIEFRFLRAISIAEFNEIIEAERYPDWAAQ